MKILMLSATFPYPPTKGGTQVRTFNLLNYLRKKHELILVTQSGSDVTLDEIEKLKEFVQELIIFPHLNRDKVDSKINNSSLKFLNPRQFLPGKVRRFGQFLFRGTPPSVLARYSSRMQTWLDGYIHNICPQVITCEHSVNEVFVRPEWQQKRKVVVNIHSSVYGTCRNQLQTKTAEHPLRERLNLPLLYRYEKRYCTKFSHLVVTTEDDRHQIHKLQPQKPITIVTNGVDLAQFPCRTKDPGGQHLVFIGAMDNLANIDAACFLGQTIFPALKQRYPDATLALVGARPEPKVKALADYMGIEVTGRVPSMVDYLHQATVCVIPMRTGFGIKNKTLEALAAGTPVVASDRGLEGLRVDDADYPLRALRANQVQEFVEAIGLLFEDSELRQTLSHNGRTWIEAEYTWEIAGKHYEKVLCGEH